MTCDKCLEYPGNFKECEILGHIVTENTPACDEIILEDEDATANSKTKRRA